MSTIRERILVYLQRHPEGIDDDELAVALGLKQRQQANSRCRQLAAEGIVLRRTVDGKIHNFLAPSVRAAQDVMPGTGVAPAPQWQDAASDRAWYWEGHVQDRVIAHLRRSGYRIVRSADTASRETGKDIEAQGPDGPLWVTVKGYPVGTPRTRPTTQASHWFKQALFDIVAWRGESASAQLALALPDFPRYRRLAEKVRWLQPVARFAYFWIDEDGTVRVG